MMYLITTLQTSSRHCYSCEESVTNMSELVKLNASRANDVMASEVVASIGIVSERGQRELQKFASNCTTKIVTTYCASYVELMSHIREARAYYRQQLRTKVRSL